MTAYCLVFDEGVTGIPTFQVTLGQGSMPWAIATRCTNVVVPKSVTNIESAALVDFDTIYGYKGTAAESYAKAHGIVFHPLKEGGSTSSGPAKEKYWVIFSESEGVNWKWLVCFNSTVPSENLHLIYDGKLRLSDTSGTKKFVYYLPADKRGEWTSDVNSSKFDPTSLNIGVLEIYASNLDIYNWKGEKMIPGVAYDLSCWDYMRSQGGD